MTTSSIEDIGLPVNGRQKAIWHRPRGMQLLNDGSGKKAPGWEKETAKIYANQGPKNHLGRYNNPVILWDKYGPSRTARAITEARQDGDTRTTLKQRTREEFHLNTDWGTTKTSNVPWALIQRVQHDQNTHQPKPSYDSNVHGKLFNEINAYLNSDFGFRTSTPDMFVPNKHLSSQQVVRGARGKAVHNSNSHSEWKPAPKVTYHKDPLSIGVPAHTRNRQHNSERGSVIGFINDVFRSGQDDRLSVHNSYEHPLHRRSSNLITRVFGDYPRERSVHTTADDRD